MRRWFLLIMIALLPIRAWVGDVMAADMVTQHIAAVQQVPLQAQPASPADSADPHADCHGKAAAASPALPAAGDAAATDCGNCTSCQVCHSVAMAAASGVGPLAPVPHAAPPVRGTHFASAEPARGFKPPIS
ncbi:MAG: hypothetical protein AB7P37_17440 [Ramlibacter sp.]